MKFCKYAVKIKDSKKHIRCKRDGSIRNIKKHPCNRECAYAELSFWERLKRRFCK